MTAVTARFKIDFFLPLGKMHFQRNQIFLLLQDNKKAP